VCPPFSFLIYRFSSSYVFHFPPLGSFGGSTLRRSFWADLIGGEGRVVPLVTQTPQGFASFFSLFAVGLLRRSRQALPQPERTRLLFAGGHAKAGAVVHHQHALRRPGKRSSASFLK